MHQETLKFTSIRVYYFLIQFRVCYINAQVFGAFYTHFLKIGNLTYGLLHCSICKVQLFILAIFFIHEANQTLMCTCTHTVVWQWLNKKTVSSIFCFGKIQQNEMAACTQIYMMYLLNFVGKKKQFTKSATFLQILYAHA